MSNNKQKEIRKFSHSRQFYDRDTMLQKFQKLDVTEPVDSIKDMLSTVEALDNTSRAMLISALTKLNRDQSITATAHARTSDDREPLEIGDEVNIVGGQFEMIGKCGTVKRVGRTRAHINVPVMGRKKPRTVYVWLSELERVSPLPIN